MQWDIAWIMVTGLNTVCRWEVGLLAGYVIQWHCGTGCCGSPMLPRKDGAIGAVKNSDPLQPPAYEILQLPVSRTQKCLQRNKHPAAMLYTHAVFF